MTTDRKAKRKAVLKSQKLPHFSLSALQLELLSGPELSVDNMQIQSEHCVL